MADADWGELTAPLRGAAQALAGSNGLLQRLGSNRGFWAQLRALNELPACVGFHPFADTREWSVDLEQNRQAGSERAAERQAWSPRLTRQARRREQIALVSPTAPAPGNPASTIRGAAPMLAVPMTGASRDERTVAQPAAGGPDVQSAGAWSALLQITQLLEELEPETAWHASPSTATSAAPATRTSRPAQERVSATRGRNAGQTGTGTSPAQSAGGSETAAVQAATDQPTPLLEQYVAALWGNTGSPAAPAPARSAARAAAEQSSAGPAPRAPSLLLPARSQREAQPGSTPPTKAADAALPPSVWPANDEQSEEAVEERINRALLEQAWLRGVDLT